MPYDPNQNKNQNQNQNQKGNINKDKQDQQRQGDMGRGGQQNKWDQQKDKSKDINRDK